MQQRYAMERASLVLIVCGVWLAGCTPAIPAQDPAPGRERGRGLYSDDEQRLLEYLADHDIPDRSYDGGGGTAAHPGIIWERREVARAFELFESGSPKLRLAIAKSLWWCGGDTYGAAGLRFWDACGPDDPDGVRYYLFGLTLGHAVDDERKALRRWLLEEADLKYAPALLKNLYGGNLFADADAAEQEKIFAFLKRLYKQQGLVVRYKGPDEETTVSGSVQEYVVGLLPKTEPGWDLLLEWMTAYAKTADDGTLRAMWGRWQIMSQGDLRRHPEIIELCETTAQSNALAESWCLCPRKVPFPERFRELRRAFEKNVWRQVFNDDANIRRSIITSLLQGGGCWHKTRTPKFLRGVDVAAQARTRAAAAAREIYDQLTELDEYAENERTRAWLDERFGALSNALLPE